MAALLYILESSKFKVSNFKQIGIQMDITNSNQRFKLLFRILKQDFPDSHLFEISCFLDHIHAATTLPLRPRAVLADPVDDQSVAADTEVMLAGDFVPQGD